LLKTDKREERERCLKKSFVQSQFSIQSQRVIIVAFG